LDEFVVMPNHMHGIICIVNSVIDVGARQKEASMSGNPTITTMDVGARQKEASTSGNPPLASPLRAPTSGSLGNIVGAFKSTSARLINGIKHTPGNPIWQRNYYEHVIRTNDEWQRIRAYIQFNPTNWQLDNENPLKVR
jgi:putative transposase